MQGWHSGTLDYIVTLLSQKRPYFIDRYGVFSSNQGKLYLPGFDDADWKLPFGHPHTSNNVCPKAVTFDLWQTLLFESDGDSTKRSTIRCQNVAKTLNKLGLNVSLDQVSVALNRTVDALLKIWSENKDVTHVDQLTWVVKFASNGKVALKEDLIPSLSQAYVSSLFEIPPQVNPDAVTTLEQLQSQNRRIGIICNTGITPGFVLRKFLKQKDIARFFSTMAFSDEVGIRKPDPKIFNLTVKKLKTKPHETIHVGDNLKMDVWGAKNAGFKAIHLAGGERLDKQAENDPTSLLARSKSVGKITIPHSAPDKTITSLAMLVEAIKELETHKSATQRALPDNLKNNMHSNQLSGDKTKPK